MGASLQLFGIMMAVMTPVILIVLISHYFSYKKSTAATLSKLKKEIHEASNEDLEKELSNLKERVQVLEEIVTDRRFDLDRKIGNL